MHFDLFRSVNIDGHYTSILQGVCEPILEQSTETIYGHLKANCVPSIISRWKYSPKSKEIEGLLT